MGIEIIDPRGGFSASIRDKFKVCFE